MSHDGQGITLEIEKSQVPFPVGHCYVTTLAKLFTLLSLSSSSIIWYQCKTLEGNGSLCKKCGLSFITLETSPLPTIIENANFTDNYKFLRIRKK